MMEVWDGMGWGNTLLESPQGGRVFRILLRYVCLYAPTGDAP